MSPHSVTIQSNITYTARCNGRGWSFTRVDYSIVKDVAAFHACLRPRTASEKHRAVNGVMNSESWEVADG